MRVLVICMISLLFVGISFLTAQNIVKPDETQSVLHSENIGKIVFLSKSLSLEQTSSNDFINTFELKENNHLDARIFLSNSLTNYLHQLDRNLSAEELIKSGNFQFSFYVDGKLIYTENLQTGAGTALSKSTWTNFRIPLITNSQEDNWGRFLWNRFYFGNGGEDILFGGKHLLKIEIRPYLKVPEGIRIGELIAAGEVNFSTPVITLSNEQILIQSIQAGSDWQISKDKLGKKLIPELNTKIQQKRFKNITSLVVIKDGKLLLEEYFNGTNRNTLHDTRSVGKSFASTLTGIAIEDGYIQNENQFLKQFYNLKNYENYTSKKDSITLKNLLTMSSVFDGSDFNSDSPGNEENMYPTDNWVKFALDLSVNENKINGKQWDYFTAGVVLIGDILHQKVPNGLEMYADKKLFSPLGIKNYKWQYTPQKVANTAGGLGLTSLDLAKYGQLYQNQGKWKGKQILPKNWIDKTFTNYFTDDESITGYGYLFWKEKFEVNNKTYEAFACSGNGGNKVYIFQNIPLVIIITATAYNQPYAHSQVYKIMSDYLLPAILNP